jgi:alanyl aminopeptidase
VEILDILREGMMDADERRAFARVVSERVMPLAGRVGWKPRAGETLDQQELRTVLLPFAARAPGSQRMRSEARSLALRWLDDSSAIDASIMSPVLQVAGRYADARFFGRLAQALPMHEGKRERSEILGALAAATLPALRNRAYAMGLQDAGASSALDGRDVATLFEKALEDKDNRSAAFAFVRAHWTELHHKWPEESELWLLFRMGALCSAPERRDFVSFFAPVAKTVHGGERAYEQSLESIDICVATLRTTPARQP